VLHKRPPLCSPSTVSHNFMEPKHSLPCSQLSTCIHPEPDQSSPPHPSHLYKMSTQLHLGLPYGHSPSGFPTNNLYVVLFSPIHSIWPAHLLYNLVILILLGEYYKSCNSSSCSFFPTLPLLHSSLVQKFSSVP
jgi:hypothetical protein